MNNNKIKLNEIADYLGERNLKYTYQAGVFLDLDNPLYFPPKFTILCDLLTIYPLIPERFHNNLRFINTKDKNYINITVIKPNNDSILNVKNIDEFYKAENNFLETLVELSMNIKYI